MWMVKLLQPVAAHGMLLVTKFIDLRCAAAHWPLMCSLSHACVAPTPAVSSNCCCYCLQLVDSERDLMRGMVETCCTGKEKPEDSPFCAVM